MAVPSIYSIQRVLRHPADSFTSENTDVVKVVFTKLWCRADNDRRDNQRFWEQSAASGLNLEF